jgi:hypothetical protein
MAVLAALGVLVMLGVRATGAPAQAPVQPDEELRTVKVKAAGVSLKIPASWLKADLTKESLDQLVQELSSKLNPELAQTFRERLRGRTAKFFAIATTGDFASDLVLESESGRGFPSNLRSFEEFFQQRVVLEDQAAGADEVFLGAERVKLGRKTGFLAATRTTQLAQSGERAISVRHGTLYLRRGRDLVIVELDTRDDAAGTKLVDDVLRSLRQL